ncbi:hypothetical protein L9F63_005524, partial [Diploptera punctata]
MLAGRLKTILRGLIFCGLWYGSICSGFLFLYCPLLPLLFLHQKLFRQLTDIVFAAWEMYPAALLECLIGTRIVVKGDAILPNDRALIIMNHRTRLDWNFLWAAMFHACKPLAHRLKIVLKAPIMHIPGAGWVMQMNCFLYIHRRWERDKVLLERALNYFRDIATFFFQILLFPEGTDLTAESKKRSNQFALGHKLDLYHQVLHPKTTGFVFLAQQMMKNGQLDAVYDITVGYPRTLPQSEIDILKGIFPEEVHFIITRFAGSSLPAGQEELKDWLTNRWRIKEETLTKFYASGSFQTTSSCNKETKTLSHEQFHSTTLYLALMFWTLLCFIAIYGLLTSFLIQVFTVINISLFLILSFFSQGFHHIEISLFRFKT